MFKFDKNYCSSAGASASAAGASAASSAAGASGARLFRCRRLCGICRAALLRDLVQYSCQVRDRRLQTSKQLGEQFVSRRDRRNRLHTAGIIESAFHYAGLDLKGGSVLREFGDYSCGCRSVILGDGDGAGPSNTGARLSNSVPLNAKFIMVFL